MYFPFGLLINFCGSLKEHIPRAAQSKIKEEKQTWVRKLYQKENGDVFLGEFFHLKFIFLWLELIIIVVVILMNFAVWKNFKHWRWSWDSFVENSVRNSELMQIQFCAIKVSWPSQNYCWASILHFLSLFLPHSLSIITSTCSCSSSPKRFYILRLIIDSAMTQFLFSFLFFWWNQMFNKFDQILTKEM